MIKNYKFLLLIILCVITSGCVWWRLLKTKNQLSKFNNNFDLSINEKNQNYSLIFKKPSLTTDDILYLTFAPNNIYNSTQTNMWAYLFEKYNNPQKATMHTYLFFKNKKLFKINFSTSFAKLIPPKQFKIICQSLGNASIIQSLRTINASVPTKPDQFVYLHQIIHILGNAKETTITKNNNILLYKYKLRDRINDVWFRLFFNKQNQCIKMQTHLAGGLINVNFILI